MGVRSRLIELKSLLDSKNEGKVKSAIEKGNKNAFILDGIPRTIGQARQLDQIVNVEGIENRFARHKEMAEYVRAWARKNFALLADEDCLSNTLTVVKNTRNVDISDLNKKLADYGVTIAAGYGKLKETTFRISHMGDYTMDDMKLVTSSIDKILGL